MSGKKKAVLAVLATLGVLIGIGAVASNAANAESYKPAASMTAMSAAALVGCPASDGNVSWGDGKVCPDPNGSRVNYRDSLTDGYCVRVKYWSADHSAWTQIGSAACVTGQWLTFSTSISKMCSPNARLYRDDGSYFTMPSTLSCA
jgi:hypothetical protein